MRAPPLFAVASLATRISRVRRIGAWAPPAVLPTIEGRSSLGDVAAVALTSSTVSFSVKQAALELTSSNILDAHFNCTSHAIRTCSALLLAALVHDTPVSCENSSLFDVRQGGTAELLGSLVTAHAAVSCSARVDVGLCALLRPWMHLTASDSMSRVPQSSKEDGTSSTLALRWSRTLLGGLKDAVNTPPMESDDTDQSPREASEKYLDLCILSLCSSPQEIRKWFARYAASSSLTTLRAAPQEAIMAAGSAMQLLSCDASAEAALTFLHVIDASVAPLAELEQTFPFDSLVPFSDSARATLAYLVAALCASKTHMGEGVRLLTKYQHHCRIAAGVAGGVFPQTPLLPSGLMHHVLHQQLLLVVGSTSVACTSIQSGGSLLDAATMVEIMQQDRARFDAASTALSKFELAALYPKVAGDPRVVAWVLRSLVNRLDTAAAADRGPIFSSVATVLRSMHARSIVAACVPSDQPLEILLEGAPQEARKNIVADLIGSVAQSVGRVVRVEPLRGHHVVDEVVTCAAGLLCELLTLWSAKDGMHSRGRQQARVPSWRQRLLDNGGKQPRTHKMEVLRDELPHRVLSSMCWEWFQHGFTAPAISVIGVLLDKNFLDVHFYPLALLSCARCAVRVEPALLTPEVSAKLTVAFQQRFSLFNEESAPLLLSTITTSAPFAAQTSAKHPSKALMTLPDQLESLVYPELHRMQQSLTVSPFAAPHFKYLPYSGQVQLGTSQRRPTVAWKTVSTVVMM